MRVAFAGRLPASLAERVRTRLTIPCELVVDDEAGIIAKLSDCEMLVTMGYSRVMADAARNLRLL